MQFLNITLGIKKKITPNGTLRFRFIECVIEMCYRKTIEFRNGH